MSESGRSGFSLRDVLTQIRRRVPWSPIKPPTARPEPDQHAGERLQDQVDVIRRAFHNALGEDEIPRGGGKDPRDPEGGATVDFLYHPRRVVLRDGGDFELLNEFFTAPDRQEIFDGELRRVNEPERGMPLMVEVPLRRDGADPVLTTLAEIDEAHPDRAERREPIAQPDHVLYVTALGRLCPYTEPEEPSVAEPVPARELDTSIGSEVKVSVVDTGLWVPATEVNSGTDWLLGVTPADAKDVEDVNQNDIHEYAGHGTFVAGIIKCLAPGATVEVEGALPNGGAVYESKLVEQLRQALADTSDPQLISISAGTYTRDNLGLLGFEILAESHGLTDGTKGLVIAAAGNDTSSDPFYPAAFPWVIGVGALDEEGFVADYSNYGCWIDVWARGSNLVNAFPPGTYVCKETPHKGQVRHFKHLAQWSGTSFSTPIVTAAIAAQMSATGNVGPGADPKKAFDEINAAAPKCKDKIASGRKHIGPL